MAKQVVRGKKRVKKNIAKVLLMFIQHSTIQS